MTVTGSTVTRDKLDILETNVEDINVPDESLVVLVMVKRDQRWWPNYY